jgi:hypothetical protein
MSILNPAYSPSSKSFFRARQRPPSDNRTADRRALALPLSRLEGVYLRILFRGLVRRDLLAVSFALLIRSRNSCNSFS